MIRIDRHVVALIACIALGVPTSLWGQDIIYQQEPIAFGNPSTSSTGAVISAR